MSNFHTGLEALAQQLVDDGVSVETVLKSISSTLTSHRKKILANTEYRLINNDEAYLHSIGSNLHLMSKRKYKRNPDGTVIRPGNGLPHGDCTVK